MRRWQGDDVPLLAGDGSGMVLVDKKGGASYPLVEAYKAFTMSSADAVSAVYELPRSAVPQSVALALTGTPGATIGTTVIVAVSNDGLHFIDTDPTLRKAISTTAGEATAGIILVAQWRYIKVALVNKIGEFALGVVLS